MCLHPEILTLSTLLALLLLALSTLFWGPWVCILSLELLGNMRSALSTSYYYAPLLADALQGICALKYNFNLWPDGHLSLLKKFQEALSACLGYYLGRRAFFEGQLTVTSLSTIRLNPTELCTTFSGVPSVILSVIQCNLMQSFVSEEILEKFCFPYFTDL